MIQPGRKFSVDNYRYGFNGKENDNEVKDEGNQQDYGMRIYDPRLGRFLSVDPLSTEYPWNSPYSFSENDPVNFIDLDGLEKASPELVEYAKKLSEHYIQAIKRDKELLTQTTDEAIIKMLNEQLEFNKKAYAAFVVFRYKNRHSDAEMIAHYLDKAQPYLKDILDYTPASDIKVLITGKDFNEEEQSRWAAAGFLVIDIFGGSFLKGGAKGFSTLSKGLKNSNLYGKCVEFTEEFVKTFKRGIEKAGGEIKVFDINIGKDGLIGMADKQLSNNGYHRLVEVTHEGKSWIFDNLHPDGVLKDEYLKKISGHSSDGKEISGETLFEDHIKEVTEAKTKNK